MPITGNFALGISGVSVSSVENEFGKQELQNFTIKGLSQFHTYIFTVWNNIYIKKLNDFQNLGRPELSNTISVNSPAWDTIVVGFNIQNVNYLAPQAFDGIGLNVQSLRTEVAVDYFISNFQVDEPDSFPSNFSTYFSIEDSTPYSTTGNKSLTFTPVNAAPGGKTFQLRLRYYNKFNKESVPGTGNNFDQDVIPTDVGSIAITTPGYPQLPPPESVFYRYKDGLPTLLQAVWIYQNVTSAGGFTTGVGYQPPSYIAQLRKESDGSYVVGSLVSNSDVNWGNSSNFNKGAIWEILEENANGIRIGAISDSTFTNSVLSDAELYPYPNPITLDAELVSTTSIRLKMNLQNISSVHPARYYWVYNQPTLSNSGNSETSVITTSIPGIKTSATITVPINSTTQFKAFARRDTDIFVDTFGDEVLFLGGDVKTISTDIRPKNVILGITGGFGVVFVDVTWNHPPAYPNGGFTGTYSIEFFNAITNVFLTNISGISSFNTSHNFDDICSFASDGDFIFAKVIANITGIGTGISSNSNSDELQGCATDSPGGNGGFGNGI